MDSVIIYELLLPLLIKLFESEQFSKDLSPDFHLDAEFNEIINNDDDDNNVHKLMKPKIKLLEKEENAKFSEVYKVYLLIMVIHFKSKLLLKNLLKKKRNVVAS